MASCSCVSRKRFGSITPVGWSDSDSDFEKENDVKAVNTKGLSLSVASDSKGLIRGKTSDIEEAKKPMLP